MLQTSRESEMSFSVGEFYAWSQQETAGDMSALRFWLKKIKRPRRPSDLDIGKNADRTEGIVESLPPAENARGERVARTCLVLSRQ